MLYQVTLWYHYQSPGKCNSIRNMKGRRVYAVWSGAREKAIDTAYDELKREYPSAVISDTEAPGIIEAVFNVIRVG